MTELLATYIRQADLSAAKAEAAARNYGADSHIARLWADVAADCAARVIDHTPVAVVCNDCLTDVASDEARHACIAQGCPHILCGDCATAASGLCIECDDSKGYF